MEVTRQFKVFSAIGGGSGSTPTINGRRGSRRSRALASRDRPSNSGGIMKKHFTLMELVCALGLLAMAATLFSASMHNFRIMDKNFTRESRALQVLDNSIERISFEKKPDIKTIKEIFEDEFGRSVLEGDGEVSNTCEIRENKILLKIKQKNGRKLAAVEIKLVKQ